MGIDKEMKMDLTTDAAQLRRHAEECLRVKMEQMQPQQNEVDVRRLLYELQVHQIELEIQNEELRRAQEELEASRSKYVELYEFAPVGYFTFDAAGVILEVNLAGAKLLGVERRLLANQPFRSFIADADEREFFSSHLEAVSQRQGMQRCEIRLTGKESTLIHGQLQSVALESVDGKAAHILTSIVDGTVGRLAAERISEVLRQQQAILDNIPNSAWLKDREGRYVAVNDPFARAICRAPKDLVGKSDHDIYPPAIAEKHAKDSREVMASGMRKYFEESSVDRDGRIQCLEKIETPICNDAGVVIGIIGIAHDITSRKKVEETLRHEGTHDSLTGLYNRAFFEEELERIARSRKFPLSIVMADINCLKTVNDTLGHEAGDDLIRLTARLILRAFRAEDIIARIGGDEFCVLLPGTAIKVAQEAVRRIVSCPEISNGQVSIAFGISSAQNRDAIPEALKLSDERMYLDKSNQKN